MNSKLQCVIEDTDFHSFPNKDWLYCDVCCDLTIHLWCFLIFLLLLNFKCLYQETIKEDRLDFKPHCSYKTSRTYNYPKVAITYWVYLCNVANCMDVTIYFCGKIEAKICIVNFIAKRMLYSTTIHWLANTA